MSSEATTRALQRALDVIEQLESRVRGFESGSREPLAIIGVGLRLPGGVVDLTTYAQLIQAGRDAIGEVPNDRFDPAAFHSLDQDAPGKMRCCAGGFIDDPQGFDAAFFGMAARQARAIDPQQRLALEVSFEALEHAGASLQALEGSQTGVFFGISSNDYALRQAHDVRVLDGYSGQGVSPSMVAGRIAYAFGLRGPALAIDTACSSALVALHQACQSLRARECDLAIAGGVNLILSPFAGVTFSKAGMLAADGRCKPFDARADGMVRSEGCVVVIVKRLRDVTPEDASRVLGIVRGSAINQDGRTAGITAPNGLAQRQVIEAALRDAGVSAAAVGYVEAHGTGTPLGDPIEYESLAQTYGQPAERSPCAIGSVKANLGHTEAAAGLAGLVKALLCLRAGIIPPLVHLTVPHANLALAGARLELPRVGRPWRTTGAPRIAAVSAFGFSGTNAHVIVEQAPAEAERVASPADPAAHLLAISARSPEALRARVRSLRTLLAADARSLPRLADLAYTLAHGNHFEYRAALVARDAAHAGAECEHWLNRAQVATGAAKSARRIAFVFSGQGTPWARMGVQLMADEPVFRAAVEQIAQLFDALGGFPLLEVLHAPAASTQLQATRFAQPAIFAVQYALVQLWKHFGVEPQAVIGHSLGEVAAAWCAGVLSLEDAARLILCRAAAVGLASGGGRTLAVNLAEDTLARRLEAYRGALAIAAVNAPAQCVVSGPSELLDQLTRSLVSDKVWLKDLGVDCAFHSAQMDAVLPELQRQLGLVSPLPARLPFFSSTLGAQSEGKRCGTRYWLDNVRRPVLFAPALRAMLDAHYDTFLELGPAPALQRAIAETAQAHGAEIVLAASMREAEPGRSAPLQALGALYCAGASLRYGALSAGGCAVELPAYPWQKQRYWVEERAPVSARPLSFSGGRIDSAQLSSETVFEIVLDVRTLPFLAEHRVAETPTLPAAGFAELVLANLVQLDERPFHYALAFELEKPLFIVAETRQRVQVAFHREGDGFAFEVHAKSSTLPASSPWQRHATGRALPRTAAACELPASDLASLQQRCTRKLDGDVHYRLAGARGVGLHGPFRSLTELYLGAGECVARVCVPDSIHLGSSSLLHPVFLDAALQSFAALLIARDPDNPRPALPVAMAGLQVHAELPRTAWVYARLLPDATLARASAELVVVDDALRPVLGIDKLTFAALSDDDRPAQREPLAYVPAWQPGERSAADTRALHPGGVWLLVAGESPVVSALSERLRTAGQRVLHARVQSDPRAPLSAGAMDPLDVEAMRRAVSAADGEAHGALAGVVHLQQLEHASCAHAIDSAEALEQAHRAVLGSCAQLAQALAMQGFRSEGRLWIVTQGVQPVAAACGEGALSGSPLLGLKRALMLEHPELRSTCVDLEQDLPPEQAAGLVFDELARDDAEDELAIRAGQPYVRRLVPLPKTQRAASGEYGYRSERTYLITGGLGAVGLALAHDLIGKGVRHLALAGRSAPSPAVQRALEQYRQHGARIEVLALDVTSPVSVRAGLDAVRARLPPLAGVFHCAGALSDGILLNRSWSDFREALAAKVLGAFNLHRATEQLALEHFVLVSSAVSILGSPGQSTYCAANTFLDALAIYRRQRGLAAQAVSYGPWGGAGMYGDTLARRRSAGSYGLVALTSDEALRELEALHAQAAPAHVMIARLDVRQLSQSFPVISRAPFLSILVAGAQHVTRSSERALRVLAELRSAADPQRRHARMRAYLQQETAEVIVRDVSLIDPHTPLPELGLDSQMAVELRNRIEQTLSVRIPATIVWTHPTLEKLAVELVRLALPDSADTHAAPEVGAKHEELAADIAKLSTGEAEAALQAELRELETEMDLNL